MVDVNIKTKSKLEYIEIVVDAYPYPVNYKGQYHIRSGATKQELRGASLDKFILQKQGKHWDSVPHPLLKLRDLSKPAIQYFKKKAIDSGRITADDLKDNLEMLLWKLQLKADAHYYKNAAVLLFHPNPEVLLPGAFIKIGFFLSDDELVFQDTIHGHLFEQVERTMALLLSKYLKATITYKGLNRMEKYPMPVAALREAVLNAIVHKDYASQIPVQISVYADKLIIWNEGQFPDDWTIENLKSKHPSRPYNPAIANVFFRAGLIEAWGRGTINILNECKLAKISQPIFKYEFSGFIVEFRYNFQSILQKGKNAEADKTIDKVLIVISHNETITISELAKKIGVAQITIKRAISELRQLNKLQREGSSKTGKWKVI